MARKVMLINATDTEEIRIATLIGGVLSDFDIEFVHNEKIKGNIYKAKVVRVDQSLQAAFIHYGGQKNGFLPIGELPKDLVSPDGRRGRIQDLLSRDQEIMVQAVREELGSKCAMMTAQVSLPGRYLVLTPGNPINGISRKIELREEREHFKCLIDELEIPRNFGIIVRTASLGVTREDFQKDLDYLLDTYKEVQTRYAQYQGQGLIWQEDDVVTRTLRDAFTADVDEVHIDDLKTFNAAKSFFKRTMPQFQNVLKYHVGKRPLFSKFKTEEQIDHIYCRKVPLVSGGAIVIDQTEALVAVDVNSGKTIGDNVENMAFKTNMEAAEEVARQLRLRDLAGLVVIDFIDMKREGNNRSVVEKLVECLKEDKARMEVGKINRFGLLVMTRQRLRPSLQHVTHEVCHTCQGTGNIKTMEALVLSVVRRIKAILSRETIVFIKVKLIPAIAVAVLNQKRQELTTLENIYGSSIVILADSEVPFGEMTVEIERGVEEVADERSVASNARDSRTEVEDETVVLGGDTPIYFENSPKAEVRGPFVAPASSVVCSSATITQSDNIKIPRVALDEKEYLCSLFEGVKPSNTVLDVTDSKIEVDTKVPSPRRRRGAPRKSSKSSATEAMNKVVLPELTSELEVCQQDLNSIKNPVSESDQQTNSVNVVAEQLMLLNSSNLKVCDDQGTVNAVPDFAKDSVVAPDTMIEPVPVVAAKRGPKPRMARVAQKTSTSTVNTTAVKTRKK